MVRNDSIRSSGWASYVSSEQENEREDEQGDEREGEQANVQLVPSNVSDLSGVLLRLDNLELD